MRGSRQESEHGNSIGRVFEFALGHKQSAPPPILGLAVLSVACVFALYGTRAVSAQVTLSDPDRELTLEGTADENREIALSDNGRLLAVHVEPKSGPPEIRVFDVESLRIVATLRDVAPASDLPAFSPNGKLIAAGVGAKVAEAIGVWDLGSKKLVHRWYPTKQLGHGGMNFVFSPDGRWLASTHFRPDSDARTIVLRNTTTGNPELMFGYPYDEEALLLRLVFSPNSDYLACEGGHSFVAWSISTKKRVVAAFNRKTDVDGISFSADSSKLVTITSIDESFGDSGRLRDIPNECTLAYWRLSNGKLIQRTTLPDYATGVAFAPDDSSIVFWSGTNTELLSRREELWQYDLKLKKTVHKATIGVREVTTKLDPIRGPVPVFCFSRNGETFAMHRGNTIRVWRRKAPARIEIEFPENEDKSRAAKP
jgi:hypothetical protein